MCCADVVESRTKETLIGYRAYKTHSFFRIHPKYLNAYRVSKTRSIPLINNHNNTLASTYIALRVVEEKMSGDKFPGG
jgi:hypothetical protein